MNGISKALETNPGTSFETVTSGRAKGSENFRTAMEEDRPFPHAIANERALARVSSDVWRAEINSTSFCKHLEQEGREPRQFE